MKLTTSVLLSLFFSISTIVKSNDLPIAMLGGKKSITIPFQSFNGYIVTQIQINEVISLECIFDTGAEHTLIFNPVVADLLGLAFTDTVAVYGSDFQDYRHAYITRDSRMKVGSGISIDHDLLFLDREIYNFKEVIGYQIDGILGMSFFSNLVISIDYVKQKITVFDPNFTNKYIKRGFVKESITVHNKKPYITILNQDLQPQTMLLDSGAALSMLEYIDDKSEITSKYVDGILGRGIGGDIVGYAGISGEKTVLGQKFASVIVNYQIKTIELDSFFVNTEIDRKGLIGNQVLSQFDVVIDLLTANIYTKPNKFYSHIATYNRSGIELVAFGQDFNQYFVHSLVDSSPGYDADIRKGDILLNINRLPMWFRNINSIKRLFSSKENKVIRLKLKRDNEILYKTIRLKDYLDNI